MNDNLFSKNKLFNITENNLLTLDENPNLRNSFDPSVYRNDIKLINGDFQPKINFSINPKETKNIFNNNFINTFNNFNNTNDNLKQNINSNTLNLNNITNINNNFMNNEYMRNSLITFPPFPHIYNNMKENVNRTGNNSKNINNNNAIINESPNNKETEDKNKINDINKINDDNNYNNYKEFPMSINSKNAFLNSFSCGINKDFYPDINKLSIFPSLNNNLLIYPNLVSNTFNDTLINYPLLNLSKSDNYFSVNKFGLNMENNYCNLIGKKRP